MRVHGVMSLLAVATMAAGLQSGPVAAAAYMFVPGGTNPSGLPVQIEIAFADGAGPVKGDESGGPFTGVTDFTFKVGNYEADLADLQAIQSTCATFNPLCGTSIILDYDLAPEKGSIRFNDTARDFSFTYGEPWAFGSFNNDPGAGPDECSFSGTCTFRGLWTQVSEPTAALLLIGGLAVAGMARRRSA